MPRDERALVVFVASPSDLEPERNRLEEVIQELNLSLPHSFGIRFDLVRWETHGYPGVGQDPQDVLNQQMPEPDIFVGLMWSRYGTDTGRAGSGTEEEFRQALERYRRDPNSVRIMFYFKDAPISPNDIDIEQFKRVRQFRDSLSSEEGALYWTFNTLDDFAQLLRVHLSRQAHELAAPRPALQSTQALQASPPSTTSGESDELGLLDYMDDLDEHFDVLNDIANRIASETRVVGEKLRDRASEISETVDRAQGKLNRREARKLFEKAATDMMQYVARMRVEIPLFRHHLQNGSDAASKAALIGVALDPSATATTSESRQALVMFRDSLTEAYNGTESFRDTVQNLPRITAVLINRVIGCLTGYR